MNQKRRKFEVWSAISIALLLAFLLFFVYPICTLLKQAFTTSESAFTFDNFIKFFSKPYYYNTIFNSFKVSIAVTQAQKKCAAYAPHHRSFHSVNPSSKINSSSEMNAALISAQA